MKTGYGRKVKNRIRRILATTLAGALLLGECNFPGLEGMFAGIPRVVRAAIADPSPEITMTSLMDFYIFSENYRNDEAFAAANASAHLNFAAFSFDLRDSYTFNYTNGEGQDVSEEHHFYPLGTEAHPFAGKITFNQVAGSYMSISLQSPLFDYITDSVEIINPQGDEIPMALIRTENVAFSGTEADAIPLENEALFAQHVVHDAREGSSLASWHIMAAAASETDAYDNSGLFGTVGTAGGDGTIVTVEYQSLATASGSSMDIKSTESTGLIAGKINATSTVNVTLSGTNTAYEVKSASGAAGGLVGEMLANSALNVKLTDYQGSEVFDLSTSRNIYGVSYAGGLVGNCDGGTVAIMDATGSDHVLYTAQGTIKATADDGVAGGVFGFYRNVLNTTFDLHTQYSVNATVDAHTAGGLSGIIDNQADLTIISDLTVDDAPYASINVVKAAGGGNFGGIAGLYRTDSLSHTMEITNVQINTAATADPNQYGGVFGGMDGGYAAYVKVDNLIHNASQGFNNTNGYFGGVVGNASSKGNMLDLGNVTVSTAGNAYFGGGLVGNISKGVIRLSGITDLSAAPTCSATDSNQTNKRGQLVGGCGDALVYALGDGETDGALASYGNGWRFVRSTVDAAADDIGTWGEVVRIADVEGVNGALNFNGTDPLSANYHQVVVKAAVRSMATPMDFVRTALNMQLNSGIDLGALVFEDRTNSKKIALFSAQDLEITADVDLSGTGITGLMRDNEYSSVSDDIGVFKGAFNGNGYAITLQVGEHYGVYADGGSVVGRGAIFTHKYNGLFARTHTGTTIRALVVNGTMHVHSKMDNTYVGGVIADSEGGVVMTDVSPQETIIFDGMNGINKYVGGLIGKVGSGNTDPITIGKSEGAADVLIAPVITITGNIGNDDAANETHAFGGLIGLIQSHNSFTTTIGDLKLSATVDASAVSNSQAGVAGLIADIQYKDREDNRTLLLNNLTVEGTCVKSNASSNAGGLLGYRWHNTNVTMNNVLISQNNLLKLDHAAYVGGLVYRATGHWTMPSQALTINGLTTDLGSGNAFGMIVHDGYYSNDGLFMDLQATDSYTLAGSGVTVPTNRSVYDEIVAYTSSGGNILNNGKGIISITTNGDLIMDGASCNTYQNVYNQSLVNPNSRYYYNLNTIRSKESPSDGEKLLLWSLNRYAAANLKTYFTDHYSSDAITGTFDLQHLSYYPIDAGSDVTIGDATFIFYNNEIEAGEAGSGNTDNHVRSTRSGSQHYLMHAGLLRNVSATVTTTGDLHFKGSVASDATYSGVFINGNVLGTVTTDNTKEIVLEGITISDPSGYLLIHSAGNYSKLYINGVRAGGSLGWDGSAADAGETKYGEGVTVASSLIGNVSGTGITMNFSRMKLDSRKNAGEYDAEGNLSTVYGTTKSLFSGATLLNLFQVDANSIGEYNYNEAEDWSGSTHIGSVTYGQEILKSAQYPNKEKWYFDSTEHYTSPTTPQSTTEFTDFSNTAKFLPYVAVKDVPNGKRELKVNVKSLDLTNGCGAYNHPYQITSGEQLVMIAKAISGTGLPEKIVLPNKNNPDPSTIERWCGNDKTDCLEFKKSGDYYVNDVNSNKWHKDRVREYLTGAYYMVMNNIDIYPEDAYPGLGASSDTTGKYAFRGVIIGAPREDGSTVKITNKTPCTNVYSTSNSNTMGLISISNGCVVKDLTIEVDLTDITNTDYRYKYNYRVTSKQDYAYNEYFPSYGAVINKIMGGDNIIDNVTVQFKRNASNNVVPFKIIDESGNHMSTVGGFVGTVVNGGLIFRNVDDDHLIDFKVNKAGTNGTISSETDLTGGDQLGFLYINPFVGKVINGYAIRETTGAEAKYSFSEDGTYGNGNVRTGAVTVTMHNTGKNYSIPDINKDDANKLTFSQKTGSGNYNVISVPNAQALYIMSIIAQSASGSASDDGANYTRGNSYDGASSKYRATHKAEYTDIGTPTTDKTQVSDYMIVKGDNIISPGDTINSKTAVPYLIYKYTNSYRSNDKLYYPARTLTQRTFYIQLTGNGTYYLPDSFRGIGYIGSNSVDDNLKIYGFNGNGKTIDLNANYYVHAKNTDPYYSYDLRTGVALFNLLVQYNKTSNPDFTYTSDADYQITNFTLSGYISANERNTNTDATRFRANDNSYNHFFTAGVIAYNHDDKNTFRTYNFSNIDLVNLHVDGGVHTGGLIGRINEGRIYINNCNADNLKIEGAGRLGGFIGFADGASINSGIHINIGDDSFSSTLNNIAIYNYYQKEEKWNYTGGLISTYYVGNESTNIPVREEGSKGSLLIRNVTVTGGDPETSYIGNKEKPGGSVGGILGSAENKLRGCLIMDCTVENINIYGNLAGGIVGRAHGTDGNVGARIVNCNVRGALNQEGKVQYQIHAMQNAGGIVGYFTDNNPNKTASISPMYKGVEYTAEMDGVSVYGYHVYSRNSSNTTNSTNFNAGGLIGYTAYERRIKNAKVEKCVMEVGGTSGGNVSCGGLVGRSQGNLSGYNLLVKDLDFQYHSYSNGNPTNVKPAYKTDTNDPTDKIRCGNLVAKNDSGNNYTLSLIGVHVENCPADYDVRECSSVTDDVLVVYADYLSASTDIGPGQAMSQINPAVNVEEGARGRYFPYVITSPYTIMGGTGADQAILTGDGAKVFQSGGNKTVVADSILSDIAGGTSKKRYTKFTSGDDTKVQTMRSNARPENNAVEEKDVKLTTYESEMSLPSGVADFSVLALGGGATDANYTNELTSYIRFLTNTSCEYRGDVTGKYKIEIKACQYIDGKYQVVNDGIPGLYRDNSNNYIMRVDDADTVKPNSQFSLVDVQFYNPADTTQIAYHLYIPVLTKKMIEFNFRSAALQGTEYVKSGYTFGNKLAGTFDSWITTYFEYVYTSSELNTVLSSGRGLKWNNEKVVNLAYQMQQDVADSTQFVLLDPNANADKEYYLTKADITTNMPLGSNATDIVNLSHFTTMRDGRNLLQEAAHFAPQTLNDIADTLVRYTNDENAENRVYTTTDDPTQAIAYAYDAQGANKLYFKKATGSEASSDLYALTVAGDVREGYYLSMYTYNSDNVYDLSAKTNEAYIFNVECPKNLSGPVTVKKKVENPATVIIGNLFEQEVTITDLVTDTTMTTDNHILTATLTSTIRFKQTSNTPVFQNILNAADIKLYQGFMVYLNRYDSMGNLVDDQLIKGSPQYTYTIENAENAASGESSTLENNSAYLYIPPVSISVPAYNAQSIWSSVQTAHVTFNFDQDDEVLQLEFPTRDSESSQAGIGFRVTSNMAYEEDKVSYSNQIQSATDPKRYHTLKQERADLTLTALDQETDDGYDRNGELSKNRSALGINARYIDTGRKYDAEGDYEHIDASSNFDVSQLPESIFDGTYTLIYTLELSQKQDDGDGFAYRHVSINDYLKEFKVMGKSAALTPASTTSGIYIYKIPLTGDPSGWPIAFADKQFSARVSFDVKTGLALEDVIGYRYSNYKLNMTARVVKTADESTGYEGDEDHIIYTNAKVNAQYVTGN